MHPRFSVMDVRTSRLEVLFLIFWARVKISSSWWWRCSRSLFVTCQRRGQAHRHSQTRPWLTQLCTTTIEILMHSQHPWCWPVDAPWWSWSPRCPPQWRYWIWASAWSEQASPIVPWPSCWGQWEPRRPLCGAYGGGAPRLPAWPSARRRGPQTLEQNKKKRMSDGSSDGQTKREGCKRWCRLDPRGLWQ